MYNKICAKLFEMKFIDESYERSEFENIRMSYEIALKQLVEATRGNSLPVNELEVWPLTKDNPKAALEWSRYFRDFVEIEKIGEGGFGDVWKSKHNLDGIDYAVKKICVKATSVKNVLNHLREVKTLASLSHVNIVPYKSCWLEPLIAYHQEEKFVETYQTESDDESSLNSHQVSVDSLRLKSDSFSIDFEYSQEQVQVKSSSMIESHSKMDKIRRLNDVNGALVPHVKLTWAVLYIQMKLCHKTLRNFLDERNERASFFEYYRQFPTNETDSDAALQVIGFSMFHQICNGLEYIHNKGIVHHDIKPSNVFISQEESGALTMQLGDFGLACPLEGNDMVRHDGFGTRLYAAMEQLEGQCCKKSDIYSLGVILIELLSKCITVMECYKKVEKLKKGENLNDIDAETCELIKRLLSKNPDKRPDIVELKQIVQEQLETSSNEVDRLKKMISDKDNELQKKDQQIDELMGEITKLRKQLSNS
jgi:eukaryotic translation initiation factor 2-alpha kinase 1